MSNIKPSATPYKGTTDDK